MVLSKTECTRAPLSTYRLQFQRSFTFGDAAAVVPYLDRLGITDCYASPYLMARPGSPHGYDICDHNRLNPELGTEDDYSTFVSALGVRQMGQIVDVVPNHMGIDPIANPWWRDVLENGPSSPYGRYFDIDWDPVKPELKGKLLLPILGDQYGVVLERGELQLGFAEGSVFLQYGAASLPVNPRQATRVFRLALAPLRELLPEDAPELLEFLSVITELQNLPPCTETDPDRIDERQREKEVGRRRLAQLVERSPLIRRQIDEAVQLFNGRPGDPASFDLLHELLENQAYRLSHWRTAAHEINYRRFFDVNDLAGLRMEMPDVFAVTHALLSRLIGAGAVTGLRVDHIDGLFDPGEYLENLQTLAAAGRGRGQAGPSAQEGNAPASDALYIVVEKILSVGESLPDGWPVAGTTGYEFLNTVNELFCDGRNAKSLRKIYARFTGHQRPFGDLVYEGKKLMMETAMASELNVLARALNKISEDDRRFRDFTLNSLRDVLTEVVACLAVYRTYVGRSGWTSSDRERIDSAIAQARHRNPAIEASIFTFLRDVLLPRGLENVGGAGLGGQATRAEEHLDGAESEVRRRLEFAMKLQQYTGAVQAKGVEDTAFYRFNQLLSLNEVGGDPGRAGRSTAEFHDMNRLRREHRPLEMVATATHDTKLGEDARARLNTLSALPDEWRRALSKWVRVNAANRTVVEGSAAPDRNDEYRFYQALLGSWPADSIRPEPPPRSYVDCVREYMIKAVKNAKVHTSWINPNTAYDDAVVAFVEQTLGGQSTQRFLPVFLPLLQRVAELGMLNSLSQVLLKITAPGVPDVYQGTELWDLTLGDPDSRCPVDFRRRLELLERLEPVLAASEPDGRAVGELIQRWSDGCIKLYVTARGLRLRRQHPEVFLWGEYRPLPTDMTVNADIVAFLRSSPAHAAVTVVPRLVAPITSAACPVPLGLEAWQTSRIHLPPEIAASHLRDLLTGEVVRSFFHKGEYWVLAADVFHTFPVALLWADRARGPEEDLRESGDPDTGGRSAA
jgi:(1->4)-alpha-D-glucan 1-alpha-D-glucosylmutase